MNSSSRRAHKLAAELRQVLGVLIHRLRSESAGQVVSMSEQAVLFRLLERGPTTTADLARAEWVTPQSMGATLARLAAERYIRRSSDTADRRRSIISISKRGRQAIQLGRAARQEWLADAIEEVLDGEEQRVLESEIELLRRIGNS